jgi:hypothetical protein
VTAYQDDAFFAGRNQAAAVFSRLPRNIGKQLHWFTVAEGAEYHDAPMAPQTRNQVVFDWLDRVLAWLAWAGARAAVPFMKVLRGNGGRLV